MKKLTYLFIATFWVLGLVSCSAPDDGVFTSGKYVITTQFGNMTMRTYKDTPKHSENFKKLVEEGFYDGTTFHRVIREFMIQGGDPNSKNADPAAQAQLGNGGPGYTTPAEISAAHTHKRGAVAAARLGDQMNPKRESSGSQFYIVEGMSIDEDKLKSAEQVIKGQNPNFSWTESQRTEYLRDGGYPWLDNQYTVFGELVEGMEVVREISSLKTGRNDKPLEDVKMTVRFVP